LFASGLLLRLPARLEITVAVAFVVIFVTGEKSNRLTKADLPDFFC
jgi:hypothetical protein